MLEIEIKAKLDRKIPEYLITALGFEKAPLLKETDVYFNGNDRDFFKTDEALRLRSLENFTDKTSTGLITYKGPKTNSRSQTRREIESGISDLATMTELLRVLGYQDLFTVTKTRQEYKKGPVTLCLDQVDGLGRYLELELVTADADETRKEAAVDRLLNLLDDLSVPRENLTAKSYLELLISSGQNS